MSDTPEPPDTSPDQADQVGHLDQLETDLDTVEASLAALDTDNLDQAEALADSLSGSLTEPVTPVIEAPTDPGGQSDEPTNES